MLGKKLIKHFETQTKLQVEIRAVASKVRDLVPNQRLEFFPMEGGHEVIRGMLHQWTYTPGWGDDTIVVNDIHYVAGMSLPWQRVVVCKEMIHVVDPVRLLTRTPHEVQDLIERIAMPVDLQLGYNGQEMGDRMAEFQALAILFPKAAREVLLPSYQSGKLSPDEIASHAEIPVRYVDFLMSDEWDRIYGMLLSFYEKTEEFLEKEDRKYEDKDC